MLLANRADLSISFISAKYPGSAHDSYLYQMSGLQELLSRYQYGDAVLLGDSGFPLKEHLIVPVLDPHNRDEQRFNKVQRIVRCSIERTIGVWKARWRIIDKQGGPIRAKSEAAKIIIATAILQNSCIKSRVLNPDFVNEEKQNDENINQVHVGA